MKCTVILPCSRVQRRKGVVPRSCTCRCRAPAPGRQCRALPGAPLNSRTLRLLTAKRPCGSTPWMVLPAWAGHAHGQVIGACARRHRLDPTPCLEHVHCLHEPPSQHHDLWSLPHVLAAAARRALAPCDDGQQGSPVRRSGSRRQALPRPHGVPYTDGAGGV